MGKEITRRFLVDGEEYEDYDGDEEDYSEEDEEWDMFFDSFKW